jgi:hypothetical protein
VTRRRRYQADHHRHMRELYERYEQHCRETGLPLPTYEAFIRAVDHFMADETVQRQRAAVRQMPATQSMLYIASPAKDGLPHEPSTIAQCGQCGQDVWIANSCMAEYRRSSAAICLECLPEITGKTPEQAINETIRRLYQ